METKPKRTRLEYLLEHYSDMESGVKVTLDPLTNQLIKDTMRRAPRQPTLQAKLAPGKKSKEKSVGKLRNEFVLRAILYYSKGMVDYYKNDENKIVELMSNLADQIEDKDTLLDLDTPFEIL